MENIFDKTIEPRKLVNGLIKKLSELRNNGAAVQAQPLGIMRIALEGQKNSNNGLFLHFWARDLPRSMEKPPLHTHVFDLRSRIIAGSIKDIIYKAIPDSNGDHQLVQAKCTQEYCSMVGNIERVKIVPDTIRTLSMGDIYEIPKGNFHVTEFTEEHQTAITIIEKFNVEPTDPILVLPYPAKIDTTPFDRMQLDQKIAWERINNALSDLTKII